MGQPPSLPNLASEAAGCRRCDLFKRATATVFGEGTAGAPLFLVGEQPGDQEDRAGRPFVGPAGRLLDRALEEGGVDRDGVYLTNAVKHFKWEERGKRRLHKTPSRTEVVACRLWLEGELAAVDPDVVVSLGATAGASLLGPSFRVGRQRGAPLEAAVGEWSGLVLPTIHPSAILRVPEEDDREEAMAGFVADLKKAAALVR
jgi:DNA polymerase